MVALRTALAFVALTLVGCGGAASNADWLREPESGAVIGDAPAALAHESASSSVVSDASYAMSELEPTAGRQRLDHTVTLGEIIAMPPGAAPATQNGGSTTVIVNVNNTMQPGYAPYYGGYGYGALARGNVGSGRPSPAPHTGGSAPVIPGQSWPAPPSYGPSFPYSTSPASPWEHKH